MIRRLLHRLGIFFGRASEDPTFAGPENVSGPFNGYFLATYAVPGVRDGFVAYYKVCIGKPTSCWECCCLAKGRSGENATDPTDALRAAHELGLDAIRNLPSLHPRPPFIGRRRPEPALYQWPEARKPQA